MTRKELEKKFISARRRFIASCFPRLNDRQLEGVMTTTGPVLLLAGAGSGKTTVLINRIGNRLRFGSGSDSDFVPEHIGEEELAFLQAYNDSPKDEDFDRAASLCAVDPVEPWRLIAITFTNKAANEMKSRLEKMLGPQAQDIWALTFHSACVRILRREIDRLGYDRSFTIYDTADSQSAMKRVLKDLDMDEKLFPPRSVLGQISRAKDAMMSPEQFIEAAQGSYDVRKKLIGEAYRAYSERLKAANALDFDDIILLTARLLLEHEDVREHYQRRFKYVLIDEYQDTNNLQYLLASTLAGGHRNICVVGDDDQSIYKFRGATIENILNFENQYKNAKVIRLEQNYRSLGHILHAANAVIRNNEGRKGKELWTDRENGDKLTLNISYNDDEEAQFVAGRILAGVAVGAAWRDFAVLYRVNAQSNRLEFAFKRNGIPYKVYGGMKFFDRAEVKDMLAYLSVIHNPNDDLRLVRIINSPPRGIGASTVEKVAAIAAEENRSMFDVMRDSQNYENLRAAAPKLHLFINMIDSLASSLETLALDEFYDELISASGYVDALKSKDTDENAARIENVYELKSNIIGYMNGSEQPTLAGFLDEVALYTDMDKMDDDDNCVVMMTMHSAKGLEFPTVFIVGAEDGIFPSIRSIGEHEDMEEERRLCYVAMTRAKEKLFFTCARQRMLFGRTTSNCISRFVKEIPDVDIEKPSVEPRLYGFPDAEIEPRPREVKKPEVHVSHLSGASVSLPKFTVGDAVSHRAFGIGCVKSVKPVGGDALIEIEFESAGTKRLMLKTAAVHMQKL